MIRIKQDHTFAQWIKIYERSVTNIMPPMTTYPVLRWQYQGHIHCPMSLTIATLHAEHVLTSEFNALQQRNGLSLDAYEQILDASDQAHILTPGDYCVKYVRMRLLAPLCEHWQRALLTDYRDEFWALMKRLTLNPS